jgi:hypothetical protein
MGTRARIAIANDDGTFESIYTHWDGYPSHHGVILRQHYTDPAKVRALIALGDLSSLDNEIGTQHSFDSAPLGECNAYGRDRGEEGVEPVKSDDFEALCALTQNCGGEYLYVFKFGQWYVAEGGIAFFGNPASKAPEFLESVDVVLARTEA